MPKIWLPPIETCCDECKVITIHVHSNATLHFKIECPKHGEKYIPSPFARSVKMEYKISVSKDIEPGERMFG